MQRIALIAALLASLNLAAFAQGFAMPPPVPAHAMAAHDAHPEEKVTFAADPYDTPQKAALFHPTMLEHAVLPILVVFTNDGDQPILLDNVHFEMVTRDRAKAEPYSLDDLRRVFATARDRDELDHASFAARAIPPHATQQGFLFFDVAGLDHPTEGARLFVTGVTDAQGNALMYFEVPLAANFDARIRR